MSRGRRMPAVPGTRGPLVAAVLLACTGVALWIAFEFGQIRAGHSATTVSRMTKGALSSLGREKFFSGFRIAITRHRMFPVVFDGRNFEGRRLGFGLLILTLAKKKGRE